jgi:hypothetical protein
MEKLALDPHSSLFLSHHQCWDQNKLERLCLESLSNLDQYVLISLQAFPRGQHLKGTPLG